MKFRRNDLCLMFPIVRTYGSILLFILNKTGLKSGLIISIELMVLYRNFKSYFFVITNFSELGFPFKVPEISAVKVLPALCV